MTLARAGSQTVTGTDTADPSVSGTLTVKVIAASAATMAIVAPSSVVANQPFNIRVTLSDRFGNVATGYTGRVHFTTSDLLATQLGTMPADYTFTNADAGSRTFSAALVTVPSQTITVTDTANALLKATTPPIAVSLL